MRLPSEKIEGTSVGSTPVIIYKVEDKRDPTTLLLVLDIVIVAEQIASLMVLIPVQVDD